MKRPILGLCVLCVLYCCTEQNKEPIAPQSPFEVPSEYRSKRTTVVRADIDGDDHADALLLVQDTARLRRCSDSVILYVWDREKQQYHSQAVIALDDVDSLSIMTLLHSKTSHIVAHTNTGGNSPIASRGLHVIEYLAPSFVTTISMFDGDPTFERLDSTEVVVHHDVFEPFFSRFGATTQAGAVQFADDVRPIRTLDSSSVSRLRYAYFEKVIVQEQASLDSMMRLSIHAQSDQNSLYTSFVKIIRTLQLQGRHREVESYVRSKKYILRMLPREYRDAVQDAAHQP